MLYFSEIPPYGSEIHSYSQPQQPSCSSKSEVVTPKPAPVKSTSIGKTGPPTVAPKVQKEKEVLKQVQNGTKKATKKAVDQSKKEAEKTRNEKGT